MTSKSDAFAARAQLKSPSLTVDYFRLGALASQSGVALDRLPFTVKILLENVLRHQDKPFANANDVLTLARWDAAKAATSAAELPFLPSRVVLQDFTGVPAVVDLAAMRDAVARAGGDPQRINPLVPADLVIDHSVQVDEFGSSGAFAANVAREHERNRERYLLLRWGQKAFKNFRVVPPGTGIVHQVNLEFLASVVDVRAEGSATFAFPDTLVGTDSHTTMINGLGVLGWGVGGIEAEAVLLGQPLYQLMPIVVGCRLTGKLPAGTTATDLVLTVTQVLRKHGVVGKFVEFFGEGCADLGLADRATLANMAPEYGATAGIFPVDDETLRYLRATGREEARVDLVERYCKEQGLFRVAGAPDATYSELVSLDLGTVEPSLAGPRRPQDRAALGAVPASFRTAYEKQLATANGRGSDITANGKSAKLGDGGVVIAAITSCTNTSNPSVMLAAGLLAKKAVARGLAPKPYVKTSLAPGSRVVTEYLRDAGVQSALDQIGFNLVGYGCTTCIAVGTPVQMANGTSRRIQDMPADGGARLFGPTAQGRLGTATQTATLIQGVRDCVSLTFEDGRTLVCTPDHEIRCTDGRWVRADELAVGGDRVMMGLDAPLDEPALDEIEYRLSAGNFRFTLDGPAERERTLAFARLLGHLLGDGSISALGQGRMNVGQVLDREAVLNDVEIVTGKRPKASRYDDRKWSIVLPSELTQAIVALDGVRVGRRIHQVPCLPAFVLDPRCPVAIVREYVAGAFGADGHSPILQRYGSAEHAVSLEQPAYSQSAPPEYAAALTETMHQLTTLLGRCGVATEGARVYAYPVRRSESSYPAAQDGVPRVEVRLTLPDGLSFVEHVGFRYAVDKALRASAAAVYWRLVQRIDHQRLWMSARIEQLHRADETLSFRRAREQAAAELAAREAVVFPHYSLLEGHDRFERLPKPSDRVFQPLHRDRCGFPAPTELLTSIGAREWFSACVPSDETRSQPKRHCVDKEARDLPTFGLRVIDRRPAGNRDVYDLSVDDIHAFVAGGVAVHNCIGNSGPLPDEVGAAIKDHDLIVSAVLSGNRNFEGRIHPQVRAAYLASPPLVVAYALAGSVDVDLTSEPLGTGSDGKPVFLKDVWPTNGEVREAMEKALTPELFRKTYGEVFTGDPIWQGLPVPEGDLYAWDATSTYIQEPPFFAGLPPSPRPLTDIVDARVLALLGDSVTTDHISPAGSIPKDAPAGRYLQDNGVTPRDFNSFGARRGNHQVMMRGTFGNVRLRNEMVGGKEGDWTRHQPDGAEMRIFEASQKYQIAGTPLLVIAGKEYGSGSSRDWAAKGTLLLGVKAVIAESYERIHRSNLVGMGVLPLQFKDGESRTTHGLDGTESYAIRGVTTLTPRTELTVEVTRADKSTFTFQAIARVDSPIEVDYLRHGGILQMVLRSMTQG